MNARDRRKHKRWLRRKWPYAAPWNFNYEEGDQFCKQFDEWRKANGIDYEMHWEQIGEDYRNGLYYRSYVIRFRHEHIRAMYMLAWSGYEQQTTQAV